MALFHKDIKTLDDLFVHQLKDIYYAEKKILDALPDMIEKATNPRLKDAFSDHLTETETHVLRVEEVFRMHNCEPAAVDYPAIDGILKEARHVAGDVANPRVLDAALIAAAQAVEHYEVSRYGTLIAWAKELGRQDCAEILARTLGEEEAADETLSELAEGGINRRAEMEADRPGFA